MTCPRCNAEIFNDAEVCKFCNFDVKAHKSEFEAAYKVDTNKAENEMKWFKFLIYFVLFADAVMRIADGVMKVTGGVSRGGMYDAYGFLKPVDIVFGIVSFGLAAFCVYTRFQLSGFKKNSPKLFYLLNILITVYSVAYDIVYLVIVSLEANKFFASDVIDLVITVVSMGLYIFFSAVYFDRRRHLFEKGDK